MSKQAELEAWLVSGRPITTMIAFQQLKNPDVRKCLSRIRKHIHIEDKWVTRNGSKYKVWWMRKPRISKQLAQR